MDHTPPGDGNVFGCPYFDELRLEQMEYINYILLENLRLATERSELKNMYNTTNMQYSTLNSEIHVLEMALGVMQKKSMEMAIAKKGNTLRMDSMDISSFLFQQRQIIDHVGSMVKRQEALSSELCVEANQSPNDTYIVFLDRSLLHDNSLAVALLYDETEETYTWVLEEFLECMKNKPPPVVVTDSDRAMVKAIQKVFPTSVHRLCAWHLQNNVAINEPHPVFKSKFNELLYQYYTEEDFEDTWNIMVLEFEFEDSRWATTTYNSRSWAECFLRGHFFGGLRTTQRSESINSYLSHFLTSELKLRDLVGQVDKAILSIRHTEREDEFISNHSMPQLPSNVLRQYYEHVASILTRNMYTKV
ncbi:protein FAR-RED IMPAIRED RESPONSE 1-like [Humulus lupulus]|uniref:protein FAR-RED IMPAIRED RESPONSE 1-like n=1 Tax=Humulus lupulus TaxID=3486 RepID=UPI002B4046A1|nr:protein FAR-RED IMPAIRED RESPONSE 1-like [Humulus lupulus]